MQIRYGPSGWVRVTDPAAFVGTLYLRYSSDGKTTELYLDSEGQEVRPGHLRTLPIAKYRALAHSRVDLLAGMYRAPDPDVRQHLDAGFPDRGINVGGTTKRVTLPPGTPVSGLTDTFLRMVAAAYTSAVAHGERPNVALAEQTGLARRTVERWVYLARKAGHLPPTRPGQAR